MRRRAHHIGRLRIRAAAILSANLGYPVQPEDISPATGSWRTDWRLDVYRWELYTRTASGLPVVAGCWMTLTQFVPAAARDGCHIDDGEIVTGKPK